MKRLSMNYKRVIALLLSGAMTLGLAACGSKQETEESKDDEQKEYVYVPEYIEFFRLGTGGFRAYSFYCIDVS